jgi:hypothetical protein
MKLVNRRELIFLLCLTAFALLLVLNFSARRAYADSPADTVGPEMIAPPDPGDPAPSIVGRVLNYDNGAGVGGVNVYAYVVGCNDPFVTTTDPCGGFWFYDSRIQPNAMYHITVNGDGWHTGVSVENPGWGQWDDGPLRMTVPTCSERYTWSLPP